MDFLKLKAVELALPFLLAPIVVVVMQLLKRASSTIDGLNPWLKRSAIVGIAAGLTALGNLIGVDFHCDASAAVDCLSTLDKDVVKASITAAAAFLIHFGKTKLSGPTDAGAPPS